VVLDRTGNGFKGFDTSRFHIIIPDRQPFKSLLLALANGKDIPQPDGQLIGFIQLRIPGKQ
jgi:hypothetical protein